MAQAIDFAERNDYIGKPENMSNNQCYALPVCRFITMIPGVTEKSPPLACIAHVSCWQLSEEERKEVARTGVIYVKILGTTLSPMSIHGVPPIYQGEGKMSDVILTEEEIIQMKNR